MNIKFSNISKHEDAVTQRLPTSSGTKRHSSSVSEPQPQQIVERKNRLFEKREKTIN